MSATVYHLQKTSIGLKRKYRVSADDGKGRPGAALVWAEKQLTASDRIDLFTDEARTALLATVRESSRGFLASLTGYEVRDPDGALLGSFGVLLKRSLERTTWEFDQPGLGRLTGTERSTGTARLRRLAGLADIVGEITNAVAKYHFDFVFDNEPMFRIEKPKILDDWYPITCQLESVDTTLLFALAVTMETKRG